MVVQYRKSCDCEVPKTERMSTELCSGICRGRGAMDEDAELALSDDGSLEPEPAAEQQQTAELAPLSPAHSMEEGELADSEPEELPVVSVDARRRRAARFGLDPAAVDAETDVSRVLAPLEEAARFAARPPPAQQPETPAERTARLGLYSSLGLSPPEDGPVHWRAEAVHLRGTSSMTTDDVMDYFRQFRPAHVEWVSEESCNAVWLNSRGPVRAMLQLSSPIAAAGASAQPSDPDALLVGLDSMGADAGFDDAVMREPGDEELVRAEDVGVPVPPGRWRLGVPHRLAPHLFLRFATRGDKQLPGAELGRQHFKLYGDPAHRGVAGIITERRRRELRGAADDEPAPDADKPNPWGGIAATWATAEAVGRPPRQHDYDPELNLIQNGGRAPDLRRRLDERTERPAAPLPRKRQRSSSPEADSRSSDEDTWRARLKAPRMRMHADDEKTRSVPVKKAGGDLRSRITGGEARWKKNDELSGSDGVSSLEQRPTTRRRWTSPLRLDYEPDMSPASPDAQLQPPPDAGSEAGDDQLSLSTADLASGQPVNIKITRDFSGDEMSGSESDGDAELSEEARSEARSSEEPEEVDVDRRTDRNSASDLRARLNRRRAAAAAAPTSVPVSKPAAGAPAEKRRPPLRIEVDNDEYYRLIGSESE